MSETISAAEKKNVRPEAPIQLIVFRLGNEEYGIRIEQVKEVTITPEIARMPKTPPFVKGVANLRGDIIAIVDLEERFHLREPGTSQQLTGQTYTLAIEARDYTIGIVVREVPQPLSLQASSIEQTPEFIQDLNVQDKYIEGIARLDGRIIIVLDMLKLLTPEEIMQLKPNKSAPSAGVERKQG
jgi:purine-binding chemotaxis protein CheW